MARPISTQLSRPVDIHVDSNAPKWTLGSSSTWLLCGTTKNELKRLLHNSFPLCFEEPSLRRMTELEPSHPQEVALQHDDYNFLASGLCVSSSRRMSIANVFRKKVQRKCPQWLTEELLKIIKKHDEVSAELAKQEKRIMSVSEEFQVTDSEIEQKLKEELEMAKEISKAMALELESVKNALKRKLTEERDLLQKDREDLEAERSKLDIEYTYKNKRLEEEYQNKTKALIAETEAVREELKEKSKQLENEQEKLSTWKKNKELYFEKKEKEITEREKVLNEIVQGRHGCVHGCRSQNIVSQQDASAYVNEQCFDVIFQFVLEFPACEYHLLHEVLVCLSMHHWRRSQDGSQTFCNLVQLSRPGIAAKVILHAPYLVQTQIECFILSNDDEHCSKNIIDDISCDITMAVQHYLIQRSCGLTIKIICEHPYCQRSNAPKHLATPDKHQPAGWYVCDRLSCKYKSQHDESKFMQNAQHALAMCTSRLVMIMESISQSVMQCSVSGQSITATTYSMEYTSRSIILKSKMTTAKLMDKIQLQVFPQWKKIATLLGFKNRADVIAAQYTDPETCFMEIVDHWENNETDDAPFIWDKWIAILRHPIIAKEAIADKIVKELLEEEY